MTPDETLIIILAIIGCITVVRIISIVSKVFSTPSRDYAARDRDLGLAKLYEARAEVLHTESLERRRILADQVALRRGEACADVRR